MPSPFFIKSKLGVDLVIDIRGGGTKPAFLDVFTKKTRSPDWDNQLWEFVPSSVAGAYLLQNPASKLVVQIMVPASTIAPPGTPLDVNTIVTVGRPPIDNVSNQLWTFHSPVDGYYFIQSQQLPSDLVIDIQGGSTTPTPNTLLDAYTKKTKSPDWDNQLWTFVDTGGISVTPP